MLTVLQSRSSVVCAFEKVLGVGQPSLGDFVENITWKNMFSVDELFERFPTDQIPSLEEFLDHSRAVLNSVPAKRAQDLAVSVLETTLKFVYRSKLHIVDAC